MEGEEAPEVKGYDFEKMIQEAMEKYGETPAVQAPPKKDAAEQSTENAKKKVIDPKKQALLEKRKKYDPRAAIKNSKKTMDDPTSTVEAEEVIAEKPVATPEHTVQGDDGDEA